VSRVAALTFAFALLASCRSSCDEGRAADAGPYIDEGYQPPMPKGMLVPLPYDRHDQEDAASSRY
jgi:hypothetical protein